MDQATVLGALGVIEAGLVSATRKAAVEGNVPDLIRLHKHFSAIKARGGGVGGRKARGAVPPREELERFDNAFPRSEAEPTT